MRRTRVVKMNYRVRNYRKLLYRARTRARVRVIPGAVAGSNLSRFRRRLAARESTLESRPTGCPLIASSAAAFFTIFHVSLFFFQKPPDTGRRRFHRSSLSSETRTKRVLLFTSSSEFAYSFKFRGIHGNAVERRNEAKCNPAC